MSENIAQTIRNLEALALRPGTVEEGELAKSKAIELSKKHGVPSIFTQPNYKPPIQPSKPRPRPANAPVKLHRLVVALEKKLADEGWIFSRFQQGKRIYVWHNRPDEEIHMFAHRFGEFDCQHFYKPTFKYRQAGTNPLELETFFNSISYRFQLWPDPRYSRPSRQDDFYIPFESESEPESKTEPTMPVEGTETTEDDRIDVIEDMLGSRRTRRF